MADTDCPCRCGARLIRRASEEALKRPVQTMPLAWTGRKPGWGPESFLIVVTISSITFRGAPDPGIVDSSWRLV
jgi:hypothetical protein